jgi:hypothetical protein
VDLTGSLTAATINTTYGDAAPTTAAIKTAIINANGGAGADIVTTLAAGTFKAAVDDVATDLANNATLAATANTFGRIDANATGYNYNESASANYAASGASVVKLVVAKANLTKVEGAKTYDGQTQTLVAGINGSLTLTGVASETAALNTGNSVNLTGANAGTQAVSGLGTNAAFTSTNGLSLANYNVADADMSALASALPSKNTVAIAKAKLTEVTGAKTYDGNTNLSGGTLSIKGVNGEEFTTDKASVVLGSKNVVGTDGFGANSVTNLSGLALTGTTSTALSSNYDQAQSPSTSNTVTIGKANLAVAMSNQTKVYDGTVTATLAAGAITATGVTVGSVTETATVSHTSGTYNDKNVNGATTVTANLLPVDFASGTADLSNYNLPSTVSNTSSNITKKDVTYSGVGVVAKTYDGTTTANLNDTAALATVLAGLSVANDNRVVAGDNVALTGTAVGTYDSKDVATTGNNVTFTGKSLSKANPAGADDTSNYNLVQQAKVSADGTITAKTVNLTGTRAYDGTTAVAATDLAVATGVSVNGKNEVLDLSGSGLIASKNVITDSLGAVQTRQLSGNGTLALSDKTGDNTTTIDGLASNYVIDKAQSTVTINKANLVLTGSRAYDGTTKTAGAILTAQGVGSESFAVAGAGDTTNLGSKNASTTAQTLASVTGLSLSTASGSADVNNYNGLSTTDSAVIINKRALTLAAVTDSKTYDGTTASSKTVIVSNKATTDTVTASQSYTNKNVAGTNVSTLKVNDTVTIVDGSNVDMSGNYTVAKQTVSGTITKANLTITLADQTKTYDGTTAATLVPSAFTVKGVTVAGQTETASVNQTVALYNDKNVLGASSVTANLAAGNFAAAAGTDLNNYNLPTSVTGIGTITPRPLTIAVGTVADKPADGTIAATVTPGALGNLVIGESLGVSATGNFSDANVGNGKVVTASYALQNGVNGLASNYILNASTPNPDSRLRGNILASVNPVTPIAPGNNNTGSVSRVRKVSGFGGAGAATGLLDDKPVTESREACSEVFPENCECQASVIPSVKICFAPKRVAATKEEK